LGAETQNNNESLNSLIWTFSPKHIHSGVKTVQLATFLAVCIFNEGFLPILNIMHTMDISIGPYADIYASKRDDKRIQRSELRVSENAKRARMAKKDELLAEKAFYEEEEGLLYGPGIVD